ncbi:unnamed protein product [Prunus armeniaca]|uniref:Uncharacterized protein n=1 Tax=Prunus armeniaca TaxID=36596 RepID=A0A6J5TKC7_PRUAR|nr:unnamed protein product [Prunus armeniaca]CAB4294030.1 unnamed protein product [Prunus armeniaca]
MKQKGFEVLPLFSIVADRHVSKITSMSPRIGKVLAGCRQGYVRRSDSVWACFGKVEEFWKLSFPAAQPLPFGKGAGISLPFGRGCLEENFVLSLPSAQPLSFDKGVLVKNCDDFCVFDKAVAALGKPLPNRVIEEVFSQAPLGLVFVKEAGMFAPCGKGLGSHSRVCYREFSQLLPFGKGLGSHSRVCYREFSQLLPFGKGDWGRNFCVSPQFIEPKESSFRFLSFGKEFTSGLCVGAIPRGRGIGAGFGTS